MLGDLYQRYVAIKVLDHIGDLLREQSTTDLEFAEQVVDWSHLHVRGQASAPPDLLNDNALGLLVRGAGFLQIRRR